MFLGLRGLRQRLEGAGWSVFGLNKSLGFVSPSEVRKPTLGTTQALTRTLLAQCLTRDRSPWLPTVCRSMATLCFSSEDQINNVFRICLLILHAIYPPFAVVILCLFNLIILDTYTFTIYNTWLTIDAM